MNSLKQSDSYAFPTCTIEFSKKSQILPQPIGETSDVEIVKRVRIILSVE